MGGDNTLPIKKGDPLQDAIKEVVSSDTDIQSRVRRLVNTSLSRAERMMATGSTDVQVALIKAIVPTAVKMAGDTGPDENKEMRESMEELKAAVLGQVHKRERFDEDDEGKGSGEGSADAAGDMPSDHGIPQDSPPAGMGKSGGMLGPRLKVLPPASSG